MRQFTFDLERYRSVSGKIKSKVFTGRDRGKDVRDKSKFDSIFEQNDIIKFRIPSEIYSITPSFLEELFKNVIEKHGRDVFYKKMDFSGNCYDIETPLESAITRILQDMNALS